MVAAIHAVPYPDPSAPLAPHCFYCWYDMPEWYARDPSLLACWEYMEAREPPPGVGGEVVFTHGDLHLKNLLVSLEDGSLVPVDLELSGRGHRASDLAFFFWHWSPSFAAKPYPCFAARQAVARAYLAASGLPASRDDVCELLYAVEYCVPRGAGRARERPDVTLGRLPLVSADFGTSDHPSERSRRADACFRNARARNARVEAALNRPLQVPRVALSRANHVDADMRRAYVAELPLACRLLRRAQVGDEDLRDAIIEQGVLALAAAGHAPGDDDAGLFGHCSTPCACS